MHIAVQTFRLAIPGADSLKAKRAVVKSIKARMRQRFNVSVAETGSQDVHQVAELTVALVADGRSGADSVLDAVDTMVESDGRVLIRSSEREFR